MSGVSDLMQAIAQIEGYNVAGTIAQRFNNPGNLRWASNQSGTFNSGSNGKFATFATPADGWSALENYINANSGLTLRNFVAKYAPPTENDTQGYLGFVTNKLGVSPDDTVGVLVANDNLQYSSGGSYTGNGSGDNSGIDTSGLGDMVPMLLMIGVVGLIVKVS